MAELVEQQSQYTYTKTANLVINRGTNGPRDADAGTGESSSLRDVGQEELLRAMGSRAGQTKPESRIQKGKELLKSQKREQRLISDRSRVIGGVSDVLQEDIDEYYQPQTQESKNAYELLIRYVEAKFGAQSIEMSRSFAHEILEILKDDSKPSSRSKIAALDQTFETFAFNEAELADLMKMSRRIDDFGMDEHMDDELDDLGLMGSSHSTNAAKKRSGIVESGVAVQFEDEAEPFELMERDEGGDDSGDERVVEFEDSESYMKSKADTLRTLRDVDEHSEESDEDPDAADEQRLGDVSMMDYSSRNSRSSKRDKIDPQIIDAHWLQREVRKHFTDEADIHGLSEQILEALSLPSQGMCERKLSDLIDMDRWEFMTRLLSNKDRIYWCTRRMRAEDTEERLQIEREMAKDPKLARILEELQTMHGSSSDRTQRYVTSALAESKSSSDSSLSTQKKINSQLQSKKQELDLDSLKFALGGHVQTNPDWKLRKEARVEKFKHKGYQEILVPAVVRDPSSMDSTPLISIDSLPEWAQRAFIDEDSEDHTKVVKLKTLNRVQSRCFPCAFQSSENLLLSAPTGAGKTNVALLTILHEIGKHLDSDDGSSEWSVRTDEFKIVYVAPMKSLVREMVLKLGRILSVFGVRVAELSGDQQLSAEQLADTQLIVTTPEKWDIITRKGMDRSYTSLVRLVIIDEIHLLHDTRGPVLEAIVARMLRRVEESGQNIRLVALSATLPNHEDVAMFLRVKPETGLFVFDSTYRPIPLTQRFAGVTWKKPFKQYQLMNELCYQYTMAQVRNDNQVIIFVHSRKETVNIAKLMMQKAEEEGRLESIVARDSAAFEMLRESAEETSSPELGQLLPYGFACHNAGMKREHRSLVEDLFREKSLRVLVSTATLAWGVNLPAHAVIIKGTQVYNAEAGRWTELSMLDILQMFGRAGRPPFDALGEAHLITTNAALNFYMPLLNDQLPIESQLIRSLPSSLNAEIVLGTVHSLDEAVKWLGYTYLFVRMAKQPELYGLSEDALSLDPGLKQRRLDLAHSAALTLQRCGLIHYNVQSGMLQSKELGRVAAHYYISHSTVQRYRENLKPHLSDIEIFRVFSLSDEFRFLAVRQGERGELARLLDQVPIPVKESVDEGGAAKINVLLQAYISRFSLEGYALRSDMIYITQSAGRLMRAIFEIVLKERWSAVAQRCLELCKMIDHRMWSIQCPLRQINNQVSKQLPMKIIQRMESANMSWDGYLRLKPEELAELIRAPSLAKTVHRLIHSVPKMELRGSVQPITPTMLSIDLSITSDFIWDDELHGHSQPFWLIIEDVNGEVILHYELFVLKKKFRNMEQSVSFTVSISDPIPPVYFIRLISDKWLASETLLPVSLRLLTLPNRFLPPTKLMDLRPLSIGSSSALKNLPGSVIESLFGSSKKTLNPIQTQCFSALFHQSNKNVLLCSSLNNGNKSVCSDIVILNHLLNCSKNTHKILYLIPQEELAEMKFNEMIRKYASNSLLKSYLEDQQMNDDDKYQSGVINLNVGMLRGIRTHDLVTLNKCRILISLPKYWDSLSRQWKQIKDITNVSLVIADYIHCLSDGMDGASYEMIISRMRYIEYELNEPDDSSDEDNGDNHDESMKTIKQKSSEDNNIDHQSEPMKDLRIVAFGTSLANAKDIGDWIGVSKSNRFNFSPDVRPTKMSLMFHTSDFHQFESRQMQYSKPCYQYIQRLGKVGTTRGNNALVFAPSSKHTRRFAADLVAFFLLNHRNDDQSNSDDSSDHPLLNESEKRLMMDHLREMGMMKNQELVTCLSNGIGYLTRYISNSERNCVVRLFKSGLLKILVCERSLVWYLSSIQLESWMVCVMGMKYYSGVVHNYVDYNLDEITEMISCARSRTVMMCHSSKKHFYRKFISEPYPIESCLENYLDDHLNNEIANRIIENADDAGTILTWTFYYQRLSQNPNYYGLTGSSDIDLRKYISEVIDEMFASLYNSGCIDIDEHLNVESLPLGMISMYHSISVTSVERLKVLLTSAVAGDANPRANAGYSRLISALGSAVEFENLPIYKNEEYVIEKMARHCPFKVAGSSENNQIWTEPLAKVSVLLQSYLLRRRMKGQPWFDLRHWILPNCISLLHGCIDICSLNRLLQLSVMSVKLCQMVTQSLMFDDSPLMQLPHFEHAHCERLKREHGISDILDLSEMDDIESTLIGIGIPAEKHSDIASVMNHIPNVGLHVELSHKRIQTGGQIKLTVYIDREDPEEDESAAEDEAMSVRYAKLKRRPVQIPPVHCPMYPGRKEEVWFLLIGDPTTNQLLMTKRISLNRRLKKESLTKDVLKPGSHQWCVHLLCDSYLGCDISQTVHFEAEGPEVASDDDADGQTE